MITKKEKLRRWLEREGEVKTSQVIEWGEKHYYNRANRTARQLAQDGYLRRMKAKEKAKKYGSIREDVWIYERENNG